jgi:hypothetical protein
MREGGWTNEDRIIRIHSCCIVVDEELRPATHYQVDLTTSIPDQVYPIVCVLIRYQVRLTDGPF